MFRGIFINHLFLLFFLQTQAFGGLRGCSPLCRRTRLCRMRCRSVRCDAFVRQFRKMLLRGRTFKRGQARCFIGCGTIPRCSRRVLLGAGAFPGNCRCLRFGLRAPGCRGLQCLFGIRTRSRSPQGFAFRLGTGIGCGLYALFGGSTCLCCCNGRLVGSDAFPGLRSQMPFLRFAIRSCRQCRFTGGGFAPGIRIALHRLHQQAGR